MIYKYREHMNGVSKYSSLTVLLLVLLSLVTIGTVSAGGLDTISIGGDKQGTVGNNVTIYINATGANALGSLQLDVSYDPSIISANSVTPEGLTTGIMFAQNIDNKVGKVIVGLITIEGVTGSGPIAKISYSVTKAGVSKLEISGVSATDASNNNVIVGSITGGSFNAVEPTPTVTATPVPTAIPTPTHTVIPTPVPTVTPAPTAIPTPVPSDITSYYRNLGQYPNIVETTDLLKAADDWRDDAIPPGLSVSIATSQLLALADEWRIS